jgi:hypothetical protein
MTQRSILISLAAMAAVAACKSDSDPPAAPADSAPADSAPADSAPAATATAAPASAQATLDGLDTRIPVPLVPMMAHHQKQNMRDHLVAIQEITAGLAAKDFPAIEKSAARIGFSEQMGQMCQHMGAGAQGFTEAALGFHHTADAIGEAATERDAEAVLAALSRTLGTCTSCHATFKQQIVNDATWSSLTQDKAPSGPKHP